MTLLKVCGLRDVASAIKASEVGADFLGFVFVPRTRRCLQLETARDVVSRYRRHVGDGGPRLVGLFADQPITDIDKVVRAVGLDMVQLCGEETPEYWSKISVPVIKQIKVCDGGDRKHVFAETLRRVENVVQYGHLAALDKYHPGAKGGTGISFDWGIAADVSSKANFLLSGGLTPENVERAIDIVRPLGVDVSSGIETGGVKDSKKIEAFAEAVQRSD